MKATHECLLTWLILGLLTTLGSVRYAAPAVGQPTSRFRPDHVLELWPHLSAIRETEKRVVNRPRPFSQLTNVSKPTLSVYLAKGPQRTRTAVLVCPGGGLQRLAFQNEGTEVARWLNRIGITACVLKYRVPTSIEKALAEAQRAMGLIRQNADAWSIDANAVGQMGFSAGGQIGAYLATHPDRDYESVGAADRNSPVPNFVVLVYPGGLIDEQEELLPEIANGLGESTPPLFIAHAFPDSCPCQNSLAMATRARELGVPFELHLYERGGHGFGIRAGGLPVAGWKERLRAWMQSHGWLTPETIADWADRFVQAGDGSGQTIASFATISDEVTVREAFAAQRRVVRHTVEAGYQVAGIKGGAINEASQRALGIPSPMTGVLFAEGRIEATGDVQFLQTADQPRFIETELGFIVGAEVNTRVTSLASVKSLVGQVVAVVELPRSYNARTDSNFTGLDYLATNIGSDRYIVGKPVPVANVNVDSIPISRRKDDQRLHEVVSGRVVEGNHWLNLRLLINQAIDQGYTIPAGGLVISGALGKVHPNRPGNYVASFGKLGRISFTVSGE